MSKRNYSIIEDMRVALMDTYRKVAPDCWSQQEAWEKTVRHPAPRYYITPKQAYQRLLPMLSGDKSEIDRLKPDRRRMYYSLYDKVIEMAQRREFYGKSLWHIIPWVITQPAPEFFIGTESLEKTFRFVKRGRFKGGRNWSDAFRLVKEERQTLLKKGGI